MKKKFQYNRVLLPFLQIVVIIFFPTLLYRFSILSSKHTNLIKISLYAAHDSVNEMLKLINHLSLIIFNISENLSNHVLLAHYLWVYEIQVEIRIFLRLFLLRIFKRNSVLLFFWPGLKTKHLQQNNLYGVFFFSINFYQL